MANRDHSLDDGIIRAAYEEFLAHGFQNASLHKIAEKAGVTTGAIYTRYKNKDALFVSLLSGFIDKLGEIFDKGHRGLRRASRWFCKVCYGKAMIVGLIGFGAWIRDRDDNSC